MKKRVLAIAATAMATIDDGITGYGTGFQDRYLQLCR
mgnify:CR=1 FL=1